MLSLQAKTTGNVQASITRDDLFSTGQKENDPDVSFIEQKIIYKRCLVLKKAINISCGGEYLYMRNLVYICRQATHRNRLIQGTDILNRTSESIARSQQVAAESGKIPKEGFKRSNKKSTPFRDSKLANLVQK